MSIPQDYRDFSLGPSHQSQKRVSATSCNHRPIVRPHACLSSLTLLVLLPLPFLQGIKKHPDSHTPHSRTIRSTSHPVTNLTNSTHVCTLSFYAVPFSCLSEYQLTVVHFSRTRCSLFLEFKDEDRSHRIRSCICFHSSLRTGHCWQPCEHHYHHINVWTLFTVLFADTVFLTQVIQ